MRRFLMLLYALVILAVPVDALAQSKTLVDAKELQVTLQDDQRFAQLMTEMWVLRDLLALHQGGNIAETTKEFQNLQDQLRNQRAFVISTLSTKTKQMTFPDTLEPSAKSIVLTLDRFGIRPDSNLGKRLVTAYLAFSQALALSALAPLCDLYPFRNQCQD